MFYMLASSMAIKPNQLDVQQIVNTNNIETYKWQANAVMKRRLLALSAGTRMSFTGNCRKQKPQID